MSARNVYFDCLILKQPRSESSRFTRGGRDSIPEPGQEAGGAEKHKRKTDSVTATFEAFCSGDDL